MPGAKVGARAVPGQRQALELTGVLREQVRVLRSQSGLLSCRAGCVLKSHAGDFLLRMPILRDSDRAHSQPQTGNASCFTPAAHLAGPGAGPRLAGQGVLSDIIAVASRRAGCS
jgi:hypothetical protein